MDIQKIDPKLIRIGKRFRKDLGDLGPMKDSIERHQGLLQPIVIDQDNNLLAGLRRLTAYREVYDGDIPCRISSSDALTVEHDENEIRKDFTHSERYAIADAIEKQMQKRQGKRTDKIKATDNGDQPVAAGPQVEPGEKTRDVVAAEAGFASATERRRVGEVVEGGTEELVQAMDDGDVPVSTAAKLAGLSEAKQRKALSGGKEAIAEAITKDQPEAATEEITLHTFRDSVRECIDQAKGIKKQYGNVDLALTGESWASREGERLTTMLTHLLTCLIAITPTTKVRM